MYCVSASFVGKCKGIFLYVKILPKVIKLEVFYFGAQVVTLYNDFFSSLKQFLNIGIRKYIKMKGVFSKDVS